DHATGEMILLLNPDTEVVGNMLQSLSSYLHDHPTVGIVGPHTLNTDGTTQSSRRRFPTKALAFLESTWLQTLTPQRMLDTFTIDDAEDRSTFDVDWIQGHALMARRDVYEAIGGLDTDYVMYFEELDWCKRAKAAGWRVVYHGQAQVIHHGGQSSAQAGAYQYIQFNRSKIHYYRKHHGAAFAFLLRAFLLTMFAVQTMIESTKLALRHKPTLRRKRVGIYWHVIRSGL
ncbi:MAG: glycosyltransferase family 2 protein, partial [Chloroflexota bacterium]